MAGTTRGRPSGSGMALTERDRRIVGEVARLGILTREQVARHLRFGSVTRANAVLLRLHRHGYLRRRTQPTVLGSRRQAYVVGPAGQALLDGAFDARTRDARAWGDRSDLFVEHELHVNDVRLAFEDLAAPAYRLLGWRTAADLKAMALGIVPDGFLEYESGGRAFAAFVEADLGTETRARWRGKVEAYCDLAFSGRFASAFGRTYFRVLVVTTTAARAASIAGEVARQTDRIFRLSTFAQLRESGPLAAIWRTPTAADALALN